MSQPGTSPFSPRAVLAIVLTGALSFLALVYFIGAGDTGNRNGAGGAHAASKGLNGYAGLVHLLEAQGYAVTQSRSPAAFETYDLLVLTPPMNADAEEIGQILDQRRDLGPTIVILPKWGVTGFRGRLREQLEGKIRDGWVRLVFSSAPEWAGDLPAPFAVELKEEQLDGGKRAGWSGFDLTGSLPASAVIYAQPSKLHEAWVADDAGHSLAHLVLGEQDSDYYAEAQWVVFVTEPDLMNNYGLADPRRAALALALVREAGYDDDMSVTFDLTLNGLGSAQNLLTLAFRPPFLAATLCLIMALFVVGWRAFQRFGPARAEARADAFGKSRLVTSGARLVLRARRLRLLTAPYADLTARRLARRLGLAHATPEAIDVALKRTLPEEEPFSSRAEALRHARKPSEILGAAEHLHELERKLTK